MKLSIVVPVYGVEKYILQFAQSLLKHLTSDVELIVINDGTKDRSIDIFKKYAADGFDDKNIIWLEQENQGQSVARNYGISVAKGDYVTFLDPDDYVVDNYVDVLLENICVCEDIDLFEFNAFILANGEIKNSLNLVSNNDQYLLNNFELKKIIKKRMWFSWLRVIKRELLDVNFFPAGVNFQDMMAFPKLYKKIKKIKNINENLVFYRVYEESSVNSFMPTEKMILSAEYGVNMYEKSTDILDIMIYIQFIELSMDYKLRKDGLVSSISWLKNNIFLNADSVFQKKVIQFLKFSIKLNLIFVYRNLKEICK